MDATIHEGARLPRHSLYCADETAEIDQGGGIGWWGRHQQEAGVTALVDAPDAQGARDGADRDDLFGGEEVVEVEESDGHGCAWWGDAGVALRFGAR